MELTRGFTAAQFDDGLGSQESTGLDGGAQHQFPLADLVVSRNIAGQVSGVAPGTPSQISR
ncbi:hypothetical protein [Actinophytocola sp. KF-1]